MAKKEISQMSFEELKLYQKQLSEELSEVNLYLRKPAVKSRFNTATSSSKDTQEEE